jgi:hypothetical protein
MARVVMVAAEVDRNTAVTTPELALWLTLVAPDTVKLFATTPVSVQPALGVRLIVAVYVVLAAKVPDTVGLQLIVPLYWVESKVVTGVALNTGAVTPGMARLVIVTDEVDGNTAVTSPESASLVTLLAPSTV